MTTLRDALETAFAGAESGTLAPDTTEIAPETPTEQPEDLADKPAETASEKADRVRDEAGRFATKPEEKIEARKPPSSWKKDYWDHYTKLDPQLQDYIDQRESEAAKGVSTYKQQWDRAAPVYTAIEPILPQLQQRGIAPDKWLQDLSHVDRVLSSGSQAEKTELIYRMAASSSSSRSTLQTRRSRREDLQGRG